MKTAKSEAKEELSVKLGPRKTEYIVDFTKMEQRNPSTGKIRALKRETKESVKPSKAEDLNLWRVGEAAECFSVSSGKWCRGEVAAVKKAAVTVQYTAPNGSKVMKHLPPDHEHLRRPIAAAVPATAVGVPVAKAVPIPTATVASAPPAPASEGVAASAVPVAKAVPMPVQGYPGPRAAPGRGFPQEAPASTLDEVPFLGERQLADVQEETVLRLRRLIRHGDVRGAQRTLHRAKLLNVEVGADVLAQVKSLEADGEFALLLPA